MNTVTLPNLRLGSIDLGDQGSIAIVDLSTYATIPVSGTYSMQVTVPGWPTTNVPFVPGSVNIYKCGDFGITCAIVNCCPLPDGVYEFQYSITNPDGSILTSVDKTIIKIDQLECRYTNAFLKVDLECNCPSEEKRRYKHQLKEINLLMNGAVASANTCDTLTASQMYAQANELINKIYRKFCLYCGPTPGCNECD